jgi:hypothetical protein
MNTKSYETVDGGSLNLRVGLGAVRCQPAKTARAWCIARVAIGTSEKRGWQGRQVIGARSAMSDEVEARALCIS